MVTDGISPTPDRHTSEAAPIPASQAEMNAEQEKLAMVKKKGRPVKSKRPTQPDRAPTRRSVRRKGSAKAADELKQPAPSIRETSRNPYRGNGAQAPVTSEQSSYNINYRRYRKSAASNLDSVPEPPSSALPNNKVVKRSKYFTTDDDDDDGIAKSLGDKCQEMTINRKRVPLPKVIRLAKQKPIAKSPMFLTSPSSTYAAACRYHSLLDALHDGGGFGSPAEESLLAIHIHFGGCPTFGREFDSHLSNFREDVTSFSPAIIETALHLSVRHLCDDECFRRAYAPIREFTFLWRDVTIDEEAVVGKGGSGSPSSPSRRRCLTKEKLFSGWSCRLLPPSSKATDDPGKEADAKKKKRSSNYPSPVVFVAPKGAEFKTRTKAIECMNDSYPSLLTLESRTFIQQSTTPIPAVTPLMETTTDINPLYSPFGLLEEMFLDDPWRLLVSTICLNVTTRAQVDGILHRYLQRWPDAPTTASANWEEICDLISPLGLGMKRAKGLIRFSKEYLALDEAGEDVLKLAEEQVKGLFMVGEYGWTAYETFILKRLPPEGRSVKVCDHALQLYVEYQLGRRAVRKKTGKKQFD